MKKSVFLFCCLLLNCLCSFAAVPNAISNIVVKGLVRMQPKVVIDGSGLHPGDSWDEERFSQAIHNLFESGLYTDIRFYRDDNDQLIIYVREAPTISSISFSGMYAFSDNVVRKGLLAVGIYPGNAFSPAVLYRAVIELRQQYLLDSMYAVHIKTQVTPLENNRVSVQFLVRESPTVRVRGINFSGNNSFSSSKLLSSMSLRPTGFFSWYTKNDRYSRSKLDSDISSLMSYYYDRGFVDFFIQSEEVSVVPDLSDTFIKISVHEGQVFKFGKVVFDGPLITDESFKKMLSIRPGDIFSRKALIDFVKKLTNFVADRGYPYATVDVHPDVHRDSKTVDVKLVLRTGKLVWVRHIDIDGNTMTKDEVIRREFRQYEGAMYNLSKIERSKERLNRLGYFSDVVFNMVPVSGRDDQTDIHVSVKERPSGQFRFGIGYSSAEKVVLSLSVTHPNVFGTGNLASIRLNTSSLNQLIDVSYVNPYWTINGISSQIGFYRNAVYQGVLGIANYRAVSTGGRLRFGIPISEFDTIFTGVGVEHVDLTVYKDSPSQFVKFVHQHGPSNSILTQDFSWTRDLRDSLIYPTKGVYDQVSAEITLPGSNLKYYVLDYKHQNYFPIRDDELVLLLRGHIALGRGLDGSSLPFFKNFYAGGIGTVRGYSTSSLGPRDSSGSAFGGNTEVDGGAELLFPIPGMGKDRSLRIAAFLDFGQVYGRGDYRLRYSSFNIKDFRYSVGMALSWLSPMGPLRFSYGYAINPAFDDHVQALQFTVGTAF